MRVAVTGSSGLIGSALVASLEGDGHSVLQMTRGRDWDPVAGTVNDGVLEGVDAVVNLAGEGIAEKRWTEDQKRRIRDSRVIGTTAIAQACAASSVPTLISGSAVGYYGAPGAAVVDENHGPGDDFLSQLVVDWEAATAAAETGGTRVVHARTGIVQSAHGGALKKQLLLFKLGLGGRIGSGDFYVSWITLHDHVRALRFCIETAALRGPVNLTAPEPVTNAEWTKALARAVHRPAILPVPSAALRLVLGSELVSSLLASQRVVPRKLLDAGFVFDFPGIDEGMAQAVSS